MLGHVSVPGFPFPVPVVWFGWCGSVSQVPFPFLGVQFSSIVVEIWVSHSFHLSAFLCALSGASCCFLAFIESLLFHAVFLVGRGIGSVGVPSQCNERDAALMQSRLPR
jgi:hypothetical protein